MINLTKKSSALTDSPIKNQKLSPLWLQILLVALIAIFGCGYFQFVVQPTQNAGPIGLQRIDLMYLKEPAPALKQLGGEGKRVVVFCNDCTEPKITGADLVISSDATIAEQYALLTEDNEIGPGYAVIDSRGYVRYRTFDSQVSSNGWEINRIVEALE